MITVSCPWCGQRNSTEYRVVGESKKRPDVKTATPKEWRTYLYTKSNLADWVTETWFHRAGCRRYFAVERHSVTNEVRITRLPRAQIQLKESRG